MKEVWNNIQVTSCQLYSYRIRIMSFGGLLAGNNFCHNHRGETPIRIWVGHFELPHCTYVWVRITWMGVGTLRAKYVLSKKEPLWLPETLVDTPWNSRSQHYSSFVHLSRRHPPSDFKHTHHWPHFLSLIQEPSDGSDEHTWQKIHSAHYDWVTCLLHKRMLNTLKQAFRVIASSYKFVFACLPTWQHICGNNGNMHGNEDVKRISSIGL